MNQLERDHFFEVLPHCILMSAFDFVVNPLSMLQVGVHDMPLLFAAFATIVFWTAISYFRGQTRTVITTTY
jgi:hypothetical protein